MKLAVAILLNVALGALLLPWLRRQWQSGSRAWRVALVVGLGGRLLIGGVGGLHLEKDPRIMNHYGNVLYNHFWTEPALAWQALMGNELHFGPIDFSPTNQVYHGMSNTFFLTKVLAFVNLFSCGTQLLNGFYVSLFGFLGVWQLAKTLARVFPATPAGAGAVAFVMWPTVIFWATGVTKENMVLASGAWLTALFIRLFYETRPSNIWLSLWAWGGVLALAIVHFKIRYFFAVPLLGTLTWLTLARLLQQMGVSVNRSVQIISLLILLAGGAWCAAQVSTSFQLNKFTNQVVRIYHHHLQKSIEAPHFEYPDLRPTLASLVRHAPQAVANTLVRPWPGESLRPQYLGASLENVLLLSFLVVALVAVWQKRAGRLPFSLGLALLVHCLVLAFLIGISTPNLGSLHRYRSCLLPYLLLLLLQNDYAARALNRLGFGRSKPESQR